MTKTVRQSFSNFKTGMLLMIKMYDMVPEVKDDVIPFLATLVDKERIDAETKAEIEAQIMNNSLNFRDKYIHIPCIIKEEDGIFKLYTINKNVRGSFTSLIEIRTESPWEMIDMKYKIPLWFVKSIPGFLEELEINKDEVYFIKSITVEPEKEYSEVELEFPFI